MRYGVDLTMRRDFHPFWGRLTVCFSNGGVTLAASTKAGEIKFSRAVEGAVTFWSRWLPLFFQSLARRNPARFRRLLRRYNLAPTLRQFAHG